MPSVLYASRPRRSPAAARGRPPTEWRDPNTLLSKKKGRPRRGRALRREPVSRPNATHSGMSHDGTLTLRSERTRRTDREAHPSEPRTTLEGRARIAFSLPIVFMLAVGCGGGGAGSASTEKKGSGAGDDASTGNALGDAATGEPVSAPPLDGDARGDAESGPSAPVSRPDAAARDASPTPEAGAPPPLWLPATDRTRVPLGDGWKFTASNTLTGAEAVAFDDSAWATVSVPHTWDSVTAPSNAIASYTSSWYRRTFSLTAADTQKRVYLYFEGVFHIADVYVNGRHLGQHRGGYTRFIFDATAAVTAGANVLAVQVSNGACPDCLPDGNTRLNKGYGGIYRKAWLVTTNGYHVATTDYASSGVYVTPSNVGRASANVDTKVLLTNDGTVDKPFHVKATVGDPAGNAVLTSVNDVVVKAGATSTTTFRGTVNNPRLWGGPAPPASTRCPSPSRWTGR